ncbi:MAG: hypothetical protein LBE76_04320 [Nitrososphaerota archaeon]|nr:hypothetical protein [Nitrososphaerota archaeon]
MKFDITNVIILAFTIAFLLSLMGYISTTPSNLLKSKRATFLFVGASIIGFCIWAVIFLTLPVIDLIDTDTLTDTFLIFSFIICLTLGAFIGELMGKNQKIQKFFFKSHDTPY